YARNYLLPRKLALQATPGNKQRIERERAKFEAKEAEEKKVAEPISSRLEGIELEISRKAGQTEALYGSATTSDIAAPLRAQGFETHGRKVLPQEPIKKLGAYEIPVKLLRDVVATIKLKVVAEGEPEKSKV